MAKKGIYLQAVKQEMDDKSVLIKHIIAQINEPNEKGFAEDPQIRITYLKPDVMEILPSGTSVEFYLDTKTKRLEDGRKYETIIPVEIKAVKVAKAQ